MRVSWEVFKRLSERPRSSCRKAWFMPGSGTFRRLRGPGAPLPRSALGTKCCHRVQKPALVWFGNGRGQDCSWRTHCLSGWDLRALFSWLRLTQPSSLSLEDQTKPSRYSFTWNNVCPIWPRSWRGTLCGAACWERAPIGCLHLLDKRWGSVVCQGCGRCCG